MCALENTFYGNSASIAETEKLELEEWFTGLAHLNVKALVVLGPTPFGPASSREVLAVYPAGHYDSARLLCQSDSFGHEWRSSRSPLVGWTNLSAGDTIGQELWRQGWLNQGLLSMVRVEFPLPMNRGFECFLFSDATITDRSHAADVVYALMSAWPSLRSKITSSRMGISEREFESLLAAADGLTAKEASERMGCTERTVNHHWSNVIAKMRVKNKVAAVQQACWLGLI